MTFFDVPVQRFEVLVLVFVRILAVITALPLLGTRAVPMPARAGLSLAMALLLFPQAAVSGPSLPRDLPHLLLGLVGEVGIGLLLGFLVQLVFAGVQVMGQYVGYQMGLGIVSVIDPQTSAQLSVVAIFENLVALLLFLALNVHHMVLAAAAKSFEVIPLLGAAYPLELMRLLVTESGRIFTLALRLGAPVAAVLVFTNAAMGLMARAVPQMNVFIVAFPVQIGVGLVMLGLGLPMTVELLRSAFAHAGGDLNLVLRWMGSS